MIKYIFYRSLAIFLMQSFLYTGILCAEEIEVNIHTKSTPKSALGIFFSAGKVVQQPNTTFERVSDDIVVVKMPYDTLSLPSFSPFVTAYLLTADNEVVFGDVRLVSAADSSDSFWRIPICSTSNGKFNSVIPLSEQLNYLDSLLQVRFKKREVAQKLIEEKLSLDLLSRLQKLERGFGITNEKTLSTELSALEMVERLSRLKDTILLYRSTKGAKQAK